MRPEAAREAALDRNGTGLTEGYSAEPRPLGGYAVLSSTFGAAFAAFLASANRSGRMPERIGAGDLVLVGVATHKVSRLVSKDVVTSFLRAPFTRFKEETGKGEVEEESRGSGLRRAVGELVSCPYCMGQWVAAGFTAGMVFAPRSTRTIAGMYTALTVSDFLQIAYKAAEERA
jgi:hypothetical protein